MRGVVAIIALALVGLVGYIWFSSALPAADEDPSTAVAPRVVPVERVLELPDEPEGEAEPAPEVVDERATVSSAEIEAEQAAASYPRARIFGKVTDAEGIELEGASVRASSLAERWVERALYSRPVIGLETETDARGVFELTVPQPSSRALAVQVEATEFHTTAGRSFTLGGERIVAGDNDLGTFVLEAAGVCTGRVTDGGGQAVAGARVTLRATWPGSTEHEALSLEDGTYRMAHVLPGVYWAEVAAEGLLSRSAGEVEVVAGELTEGVDFELAPALEVSGYVIDDRGVQLAGVQLRGLDTRGGGESLALSAEDGSFTLLLPWDEPYSIRAQLEGYQSFLPNPEQRVEPGTVDLELVLPRFETTTFVVLDDVTGAPIERFGLRTIPLRLASTAEDLERYDEPAPLVHHAGGAVELPGDARYHDYAIVAPGYAAQRGEVRHDLGSSTTQTLRLAPGGSVVGRLVALGEPQPWPVLELSADLIPLRLGVVEGEWGFDPSDWCTDVDAFQQERLTLRGAEDGTFRIDDLGPGTYELILKAAGRAPRKYDNLRVRAGETIDLGDIEAFLPSEIRGWIELDGELSVAGLVVSLGSWQEPDRERSQTTDASGEFVFAGLAAGVYFLWVDPKPGVLSAEGPLRIEIGRGEFRSERLDLSQRIACEVELRVLINGDPAPNMRVDQWASEAPQGRGIVGSTDADGILRIEVRRRGGVGLGVFGARGQYVGQLQVGADLRPGRVEQLTLEVEAGWLSLRLSDWFTLQLGHQDELALSMLSQRDGASWWSPGQERADWNFRDGALFLDVGWIAPGGYQFELTSGSELLRGAVVVPAGGTITYRLGD